MTGVKSIERAVCLLRAIAERNREGARLTQVARAAGLSKSTAHRILAALIDARLVEQNESTGLFYLGFEAVVIGAAGANRHHLIDMARPSMLRLAERSADTVYLTARIGFEAVCVAREEGSFPIKTLSVDVGTRRPLGVGGGNLAMLARLPDSDIERAIALHGDRIFEIWGLDATTICSLVEATRRQQHAFVDGQFIPGMAAIGVAIEAADGLPFASLSIAAISNRMQGERRFDLVSLLQEEARVITTLIRNEGRQQNVLMHLSENLATAAGRSR